MKEKDKQLAKRIGLGAAIAAASYLALDAAVDYDNDVNPSVGVVTAHSEPDYDCQMVGKINECGWHYWLYIDGCGALPEANVAQARRQEKDWEPQKGWVKVSGDTWSAFRDGDIIQFSERSFLDSIEVFGQNKNNPQPCEK